MKKHILVTGGSGFVGSILAKRLSAQGHSVRVLDLIDEPSRPENVDFFQADIRDPDAVKRALKDIQIVYHNVALVPLTKAGEQFWDVNVNGTSLLLNLCRKQPLESFVHVSSSAVFGTPQCPITVDTPVRPVEIYGMGKLAGEDLVKQYMSEGHAASIIRPRTVLGDFRLGIFHILFEWISENRNIYVIGKGDNLFQFIHVDDLIEAMILSSQPGRSGIYNIGTDRYGTLREDLQTFIHQVHSKSKVKSLPQGLTISTLQTLDRLRLSPLAPWHYLTYHKPFYFDLTHEKKSLDWQPKYSNVEMFLSSYEWYLSHREALKKELPSNGTSTHHSAPKQRVLKLLKWIS